MIIILKRTLYQKEFGNKINKTANTLSLIQPQIQKKQQEITSGNNLLGIFTGKNRENNATAARFGQIKAGGAGSEADRAARAKSGTTTIADQQANMIHNARAARNSGSHVTLDTSGTTGSVNRDKIIRGSQNIRGKTVDSTSTFKGTLGKKKGQPSQKGKNIEVTRKVAVRSMDDSTVTNGTIQERLAKLSPEQRAQLDARVKARKLRTISPTSTPKPSTIISNNNVNKQNNALTSIGGIKNNNTTPKLSTIIPNNNVNKQNNISTSIGSIQNNSIVPKPPTNQNNGSILSGLRKDASNTWNSLKQGATNTWNGMSTASKRMLTGAAIIGGGLMIANNIRRRRQAEEDARMARRYGRYY